jgi:hypothetical protein
VREERPGRLRVRSWDPGAQLGAAEHQRELFPSLTFSSGPSRGGRPPRSSPPRLEGDETHGTLPEVGRQEYCSLYAQRRSEGQLPCFHGHRRAIGRCQHGSESVCSRLSSTQGLGDSQPDRAHRSCQRIGCHHSESWTDRGLGGRTARPSPRRSVRSSGGNGSPAPRRLSRPCSSSI